jgi:hypothetical protein
MPHHPRGDVWHLKIAGATGAVFWNGLARKIALTDAGKLALSPM